MLPPLSSRTLRHAALQAAVLGILVVTAPLHAQTQDPTTRIRELLPRDVATRVLATVAEARARQLPADALEMRALKFAARGEAPAAIERAVAERDFRPRPSRLCDWCDFRPLCPSFGGTPPPMPEIVEIATPEADDAPAATTPFTSS